MAVLSCSRRAKQALPDSKSSNSFCTVEHGRNDMNMNMKGLCLAIGLLGTASFVSTAMAGISCSAGKGCKVGKPAPTAKAAQPQSGASQSTAPAPTFYSPPLIAPIWTTPHGQTYGHWAAEWWQWALGVPAAKNPVVDTTGKDCGQRQVGQVWFLAGAFTSDPVIRNCAVPAGKSLFFPLINLSYGAWLSDPPETQTEAYVRAAARCTGPVKISVKIDGLPVPKPERYFTGASGSQSPIFVVQMPPGNVVGDEATVPELVLIPTAEQGYYLFVWPLKRGKHTIEWQASASGCLPPNNLAFTQNITQQSVI